VLDSEALELALFLLGQGIVGGTQIGELGLAAARWDLASRQQRASRRDMLERAVGVPELVAEIERPAAILGGMDLPLLVEVRDVGDLLVVEPPFLVAYCGLTSSDPKLRLKRICSSSLTGWSGKTSTARSLKAVSIAATRSAGTGRRRSMPRTSARCWRGVVSP